MKDGRAHNVDPARSLNASQAAGLTLSTARRVVEAVEGEAAILRVAMSCAVVDLGGHLVAFARMDAADIATGLLAQDKAFTSALNQMSTAELGTQCRPGGPFYGYHSSAGGRMVLFPGGIPLYSHGILVGALGVSGGSPQEDERAALAGRDAFDQDESQ